MARPRLRILPLFVVLAVLGGGAAGAWLLKPMLDVAATMADLVEENERLAGALANLGHADPIGHAKVVAQRVEDGVTISTIKMITVDRDDPHTVDSRRTFEVRGDEVYFDLLIVNFDDELVADGRQRSLYLWRRVFGSAEKPEDGQIIERPGSHPERYAEINEALDLREELVFWNALWDLANDPDRLAHLGITGISGKAIYHRVEPGLIYSFTLRADGEIEESVIRDPEF